MKKYIIATTVSIFAIVSVVVAVMIYQADNVIPNTGGAAITVLSPNGGEVWQKGTTHTIRWTSPNYIRATYVDLRLTQYFAPCPSGMSCPAYSPMPQTYTIASNISINQNSYNWPIANVDFYGDIDGCGLPSNPCQAPVGQYTVQICETGTNNCDSSDGVVTIMPQVFPSN